MGDILRKNVPIPYAKYMQPISNYLSPPEPVSSEDTEDDYEEFEDD